VTAVHPAGWLDLAAFNNRDLAAFNNRETRVQEPARNLPQLDKNLDTHVPRSAQRDCSNKASVPLVLHVNKAQSCDRSPCK
jgi:hypothetical protein